MKWTVRVRPGASKAAVEPQADGSLKVSVRQRAVEGQANEAVREALAEHLGVPRSKVVLRMGQRSRTKIYEIQG